MYRKSQMIARMSLMLALLIITARLVIPLPLFDYLSLQIITVYLIYPTLGMKNGLIVTCSYSVCDGVHHAEFRGEIPAENRSQVRCRYVRRYFRCWY